MLGHEPDSPAADLQRQYDQEVTKLYDDYADQTYRCTRRGLSHQDAEEIVNFAFLAARVNWERVRSDEVPIGHVLRTALNLRADALTRTVAERGVTLGQLTDSEVIGTAAGPAPDRYTALRRLLQELSPHQEQVVVLYYWIGLPVRQIAGILAVAPGHVSRTLYDAGARLRRLLDDDDTAGGSAS